jgi:hypothetical protein
VNLPVDLLAFRAAVLYVFAADTEFAKIGTESAFIVRRCHGVVGRLFGGDGRLKEGVTVEIV